ncbi:MAG: permease [Thermoguttaceae bacterium]|nr:permease [Thermoguttaceae bacterium]
MKKEIGKFLALLGVFLAAYFIPVGEESVRQALLKGFEMLQWYAVYHTLGCVVPAMFIAGAISTFASRESVLRFLGPGSNRILAYGTASVSGVVLAVCSCSVLPMFAGIFQTGAGLGPASTFLAAGPGMNLMAIFLSARVLGLELGAARTVLAIGMSIFAGLGMAWIFRKSEQKRIRNVMQIPESSSNRRSLRQMFLFFAAMLLFLILSDWVPSEAYAWSVKIHEMRPLGCLILFLSVVWMAFRWFNGEERREWMSQTWSFAKSIVPLLFGGVFVTGFLTSLLPQEIVAQYVGGNSITANLTASTLGMFWYFSTLTEIPMVESLLALGMGKGPALALLLAGPTLSLPSIFVLARIMGWKKTLTFSGLTVIFSTLCGMIFGIFF